MTYLGRATGSKLKTKINGTHELTFQMPDQFFDSQKGQYVDNEFTPETFNERKLKLKYDGEWLEFYVKTVTEEKKHKTLIKKYTCTDAFIDELSRNGYGITFDTELYNNVEEIGTFTETILEDSIWEYEPKYNWGDFTEYTEEKLFKVPVSMFKKIACYKLNYSLSDDLIIENAFSHKKRQAELSDDIAAAKDYKTGYFWDGRNNNTPLLDTQIEIQPIDGYIYIPYSQLQFCYKTTTPIGETVLTSTEEVCYYESEGVKSSYAITPNSVDPKSLIQFIAFTDNEKIEIDEAGLIVNKNHTYVMTVEDWNNNIISSCYYQFLPKDTTRRKEFIINRNIDEPLSPDEASVGNKAGYYNGYLDKINDIEVKNGKKISIANRTEINITKEIDQFVEVYNSISNDYENYEYYDTNGQKQTIDLTLNPDENWVDIAQGEHPKDPTSYRVCSKTETRQIVPQLARNLIQNGKNIQKTDGWEIEAIYQGDNAQFFSTCTIAPVSEGISDEDSGLITNLQESYLEITPGKDNDGNFAYKIEDQTKDSRYDRYNTVLNFGIVAQEQEITMDKIYCLGLQAKQDNNDWHDIFIKIGEGKVLTHGEYEIDWENGVIINVEELLNALSSNEINSYFFIKFSKNIKNPYLAITTEKTIRISRIDFFEAFTKGKDQFDDAKYRYSGRNLFDTVFINETQISNAKIGEILTYEQMQEQVLFEEDIMPGDTYEYKKYFFQQAIAYPSNYQTGVRQTENRVIADTFMAKQLLSEEAEIISYQDTEEEKHLPFSSAQFTDDDIEIATKYIDLNKCPFYCQDCDCDCSYTNDKQIAGEPNKICLYQKYGYCPYLFQSEKHCRKIRTLTGEKSNRFNLTQELSKVFKVYPIYWIEHDEQGKVIKEIDENGTERMKKKIFYITEKGIENQLGFRYEKNLSNISRTLKSDQIVTKLYVQDVDSELSKTGLCSIKTAEDNPSKDSFIIDFSYYTTKGILDKDLVNADLYGINENDYGYLKQLGHFNSEYDKLSDLIINLSNESYTELQGNVDVNFEGILTAQKQLIKYKTQMDKYKNQTTTSTTQEPSKTYLNYQNKYKEQFVILNNLIYETFFDADTGQYQDLKSGAVMQGDKTKAAQFFDDMSLEELKDSPYVKQHTYQCGMLGQFNKEYLQLTTWKKMQSNYLKLINKLSLKFFRKYEPYLKEGTWTDSNYLTDNAYYFGAKEVAAEGAIPKVSYNISVVDLYALPEYEDYKFDVADTTYVEDIDMFGINPITGFPNRLKVIISEKTNDLDEPKNNSISIQNFTTQFDDLFQQVTASVQSLTFNENIYKRSSNFTSTQNVEQDSLQGTLDTNELTLLKTQENNISLDKEGQAGSDINNHSNKYKLNGQGLFFSNNGGQTWNVGVGPSGINADYIKVGTLDAGKVRIVDNDYLYFMWDKDGIVALRDPTKINSQDQSNYSANDFAVFNRYGLSLVEEGQIRLRAGYNFTGGSGKYNTEDNLGKNLGFYLYDKSGNVIFSTSSEDNTSARLGLTGEILATDEVMAGYDVIRYIYSDLRISCYESVEQILVQSDLSDWSSLTLQDSTPLLSYLISYIGGQETITVTDGTNNLNCRVTPIRKLTGIYDSTYYYEGLGYNVVIENYGEHTYLVRDNKFLIQQGQQRFYFKSTYEQPSISSEQNKDRETIDLTYYVKIDGERNVGIRGDYYRFVNTSTQNGLMLYATKNQTGGVVPSGGRSIGVLINNKAINDSSTYGEYKKRILSCVVSGYSNCFKNLFTILSDGSLQIGGYLQTKDGIYDSVTHANDYAKFDSDKTNTVSISADGQLYIGTQNLMEYFSGQIEELAQAIREIGLIEHNHTIAWGGFQEYKVKDNDNHEVVIKLPRDFPAQTDFTGGVE